MFDDFDLTFQRTSVAIRLLGSHYVARSEAKRLLSGLEKFRLIELVDRMIA